MTTDNSQTGNGQPKRKRGRPKSPETEKRIEQCRGLLRLGFADGDIRRLCSKKWNLAEKSIPRFVTAARRRNRESIELTEDQHLASSVSFWSRILQEAEAAIGHEQFQITKARQSVEKAEAVLDDPESSMEQIETAADRRKDAIRIMEHSRKAIYANRRDSMDARQQLDKLLGCHAPTKFANTTKDGRDVDTPADIEPITQEQENAEIDELWKSISSRGSGTALDDPVPPDPPEWKNQNSNGDGPSPSKN